MVPLSGAKLPLKIFIRVLLPAPFGPRRPFPFELRMNGENNAPPYLLLPSYTAMRYDISLIEAAILYALCGCEETPSRKELSDLIGCSLRRVTSALQKLVQQDFLLWTEQKISKRQATLTVHLLPPELALKSEFDEFDKRYDLLRFSGFSDSERELFCQLEARISKNLK